jgi:hypothetical protein
MISGDEYKLWSSSLCNFLHSPVTSSLLGPNILLRTLFSNTLSLCSSLSVRDQVSHQYKTTGLFVPSTTSPRIRRTDHWSRNKDIYIYMLYCLIKRFTCNLRHAVLRQDSLGRTRLYDEVSNTTSKSCWPTVISPTYWVCLEIEHMWIISG